MENLEYQDVKRVIYLDGVNHDAIEITEDFVVLREMGGAVYAYNKAVNEYIMIDDDWRWETVTDAVPAKKFVDPFIGVGLNDMEKDEDYRDIIMLLRVNGLIKQYIK
jgi:hypothetical protein